MTAEPRARLPHAQPVHPSDPILLSDPIRKIRFLHPGYPPISNILLQFCAFDAQNRFYYETALDACAVVANNRWDGFFSTDRDGQERVDPDALPGRCLDGDEYYFHVPRLGADEIDKDYPIVPTFAEWRFPHDGVPAHWSSRSEASLHLLTDRCCMTKSSLALETAHILPTNPADVKWFDTNLMARYASVHSQSNTLRLKVDVHQVFDRKPQLAITPKYGQMVAHIFNADDDGLEAVHMYHNVPVQSLRAKEVRFFLARMAWTVFPHLGLFMKARVRRKLVRLVNLTQVVQETDGDRCIQIFQAGRSRSASPRKRPADQMRTEPEEREDPDGDSDERNCDWQARGRKRWRSSLDHLTSRNGSSTSGGFEEESHFSGSELSGSTNTMTLASL